MKKMQVQNAKGEVRIIAGLWRGRKLPVLNAEGLRPTGDRVKETLFNWLMPYIVDSHCLDCFAGSGSLGFEALSRQAKQVTFLELDKTVANQLKKNLQTLKTTSEQAQVINQNSLEFLKQAQNQPHFDVFRYSSKSAVVFSIILISQSSNLNQIDSLQGVRDEVFQAVE